MLRKPPTIVLLCCVLSTVVLAACGSMNSNATSDEPGTVHMNNTEFLQSSVEIKKGESLTLVSDTFIPHIIANGSWQDGEADTTKEPGAPDVNEVTIDGNSSGKIGPFNTVGTFKLYCTIHPGMDIVVTVVDN